MPTMNPMTTVVPNEMGIPVLRTYHQIVAQPKSSLPELVEDGVNGRLIAVNGSEGLENWTSAVRSALTMESGRKAPLASAVRERTLERFDWQRFAWRYREVYLQMEPVP